MKTQLTNAKDLSGSDISVQIGPKVMDKLHIPPKNKAELAANLVTVRTAANISQSDLADVFSMSQGAIGNWESLQVDGRVPPPYVVMLLATLFDVPIEAFVLAGDPMVERLNSQLKAVLSIKTQACSTYEIKEVFKAPIRVTKLEGESAQNTRSIRQAESAIASLLSDVTRIKQDLEQVKQGLAMVNRNHQSPAEPGALSSSEASQPTPMGQVDMYRLPFGKMMEEMGFNMTGAVKHQTVVISEPVLMLDTAISKVYPSIAVYNPDATDLDQLDGKLAVIENSFGMACIREVRKVRDKYFACAVTAMGVQEMQDIELQNLKVLGKLTAITKVIPDEF